MNIKYLFSIVTIVAIVASGCDKISDPYPGDLTVAQADPGIQWDDSGESVLNNNLRFILLEEYTGHTCPNCPESTQFAKELKEEYKPSIVLVAIHAGGFSETKTGDKYTTDFRTETGNELRNLIQPISYPRATISRIPDDDEWAFKDSKWRNKIEALLNDKPIANMYIKNRFDDSTGIIQSEVIIDWLESQSSPLNFQLIVIEDKIIDWQTDGAEDVPDYEHNKVLRASINGTFGQKIDEATENTSDTIITNFQLPANALDIKNCSVVGFLFKPGPTDFEVLQANEATITSQN